MAAAGATGSCSAFSAIPINNSVGRNGVVRSRVTRIGSAVDVQQRTRSSVAGNNSWSKSNEVCFAMVDVSSVLVLHPSRGTSCLIFFFFFGDMSSNICN